MGGEMYSMKLPSRKCNTLLVSVFLVVGGLALACYLWVKQEQRQYAINRALIDALRQGNISGARLLVNAGANPNTRYLPPPQPTISMLIDLFLHRPHTAMDNSPTAFMIACGDIYVQETFPATPYNSTIVMPVDKKGDPELTDLARLMLAHGAVIDARDANGCTALMLASDIYTDGMVALLLDSGAQTDLQDDNGQTALHHAAISGDPDAVQLLIKHHANVYLTDTEGYTADDLAHHGIHKAKIIQLLENVMK